MTNPFHDTSAAILAGGLGTRLRSVISDRPKVLAPVAGRPYLAHLLDQLGRAGVSETVLLIGYGADQVRATFGDHLGEMRLAYSQETEPLGTGGAVRLALPLLRGDTVLLLNGDSYFDVDLRAFHDWHRAEGGAASLALAHAENASRFGRVQLEGDRIVKFEEKAPAPAPGWINAGVYLFCRDLIESIPAGRPVSLERDVFPGWVAGGDVRGYRARGKFIDIGTPESYAAADKFFAAAA